jgi:arginase family enzyme
MSNTRLNIQQLRLRCRGIDPAVAEAAIRRLGPDLLRELARQQHPWPVGQTLQIDRLELGNIQVERPGNQQQISKALIPAISTAITQNLHISGGGNEL